MEKMKQIQVVIAGLLVAVGLTLLGIVLGSSLLEIKDKDRVVNVKGLSEKEFPADKVIWPLIFKEIGNDPEAIYRSVNAKNKAIVAFLVAQGLKESEVTISAPQIIDMQAERYMAQQSPYKYNVTSVLTVNSTQVDLILRLMSRQSELLQKGIALVSGDYNFMPQFLFTRLNEVKPAMIEEATKNARNVAEKFAKDSESKLGKIRDANQGQFSIENRDANTPHIKQVRVVTSVSYYLKD